MSRTFIEFREFRESDKSLKHELGYCSSTFTVMTNIFVTKTVYEEHTVLSDMKKVL